MQAVADVSGLLCSRNGCWDYLEATLLLGVKWLAWVLLLINLIAYAVLSFFDYPRHRLLLSR
jgi:hypothetical protein